MKPDACFRLFGLIVLLALPVFATGNQCNLFPETMHAAENRALHGFVYARRTVRSRVTCGRDCIMDKRCKSFNFNDFSKTCELNLGTRLEHPGDFNATEGSAYFDKDETTPLYSLADADGDMISDTGVFYTCSTAKPLGMKDGGIPDNHLTASSALGNQQNYYGPQRARLYLQVEGRLCGEQLGMEDGSIPDSSITASSVFNERSDAPGNCEPHNGRLNYPGVGSIVGGWCPARNDKESPWFEVDLAEPLQVEGVIIQGRVDPSGSWKERVTEYQVQYSNDRSTWVHVTNGGPETGPQTFDGNVDQTTPVNSSFNKPIQARYIRIRPTSYNSWPSMRVELLGCKESVGASCWCAAANDTKPWIQVDFNNTVLGTGLVTQGRGDGDYQQWVSVYRVRYSDDGQSWTTVKDQDGTPAEFLGNSDNHTPVTARFAEVVRTRYLRIIPTEWNGLCCMRFEVMGCIVAN